MTGRAMGYCAGFGVPGYLNPGPGLGLGRRIWCRGPGFGYWRWPRWFWARRWYPVGAWVGAGSGLPVDQEQALAAEAEALRQEIKFLENRLSQIDNLRKGNQGDSQGEPSDEAKD